MPRLTVPPKFIGTSGIDTLVGEELDAPAAIGIEVLNGGVIRTFSGNDTLIGKGTGGIGKIREVRNVSKKKTAYNIGGNGTGISNIGSLNAGDGKDTIIGTGNGGAGGIAGVVIRGTGGGGVGISNIGSLNAGSGDDTITGTGIGGRDDDGDGIGISNSGTLDAGDGNDTITGTGAGGINGADDAGIILIVMSGSGSIGSTGIGISNNDTLDAGNGNDTIAGTGAGGSGGGGNINTTTGGTGGTGIGISNSGTLNAGNGNDTITGTGTGGTGGEGGLIGFTDSIPPGEFRGKNGDGGAGIGISNDGIIDTGNGHDILTGQATTTIGGTAYGIYGQGIIKTGDGNDKVTATSNIDKVQHKVTIGGGIRFELGTGNDYFKGFGSAIVDGGNGFDTLDVSAFKRSEVSVSGIISGKSLNPANINFNNNGNLITLSTTGFDNFIFADSSFSYSSLT